MSLRHPGRGETLFERPRDSSGRVQGRPRRVWQHACRPCHVVSNVGENGTMVSRRLSALGKAFHWRFPSPNRDAHLLPMRRCVSLQPQRRQLLTDRQTDRQTDRYTHTHTPIPSHRHGSKGSKRHVRAACDGSAPTGRWAAKGTSPKPVKVRDRHVAATATAAWDTGEFDIHRPHLGRFCLPGVSFVREQCVASVSPLPHVSWNHLFRHLSTPPFHESVASSSRYHKLRRAYLIYVAVALPPRPSPGRAPCAAQPRGKQPVVCHSSKENQRVRAANLLLLLPPAR
ncbi:hypothetical protein LY76DRAFT_319843 [Colletotrichum caudatum]|nr:hypothetical protein LY76DRAFT_319843 [Colletotrichum caudatum]